MSTPLSPSTRTLAGRYALHEVIGEGRTARVFRAVQSETGRSVAVKLLRSEYNGHATAVRRFHREARSLAAFDHRHIVAVLDAGSCEAAHYLVMPLLCGEDLEAVLQREGRLPWERTRELVLQLCDALEHMRARGLVHGDIKPSNCFIGHDCERIEHLTLIDLGSSTCDPGEPCPGTPPYRAPEQAIGGADARSDVYALSALVFRMLTGRVPIPDRPGGSAPRMSWVAADRRFSSKLEQTVARALQRRPDARQADVAAFAAELRACHAAEQPPMFARGRPMTSLLLLTGTLIALFLLALP